MSALDRSGIEEEAKVDDGKERTLCIATCWFESWVAFFQRQCDPFLRWTQPAIQFDHDLAQNENRHGRE
jgi:hypothetical protein